MVATTPTQGFTYMTSGDRPCDLVTVVAALALELDTKGLQYDTDLSGAQTPTMVRVSVTAPGLTSSAFFDTVEYNNGTPTDLTQFNGGVLLNPGVYMVGQEVRLAATLSSSYTTFDSTVGNASPSWLEYTYQQTSAVVNAGGVALMASTYATPMQGYVGGGLARISTASSRLSGGGWQQVFSSQPVVYYAAIWAVQIAQV